MHYEKLLIPSFIIPTYLELLPLLLIIRLISWTLARNAPLRRHTPHLLSRIHADIEIGGALRVGIHRHLAATIIEDPDLLRV
jgi:hypothetical protein